MAKGDKKVGARQAVRVEGYKINSVSKGEYVGRYGDNCKEHDLPVDACIECVREDLATLQTQLEQSEMENKHLRSMKNLTNYIPGESEKQIEIAGQDRGQAKSKLEEITLSIPDVGYGTSRTSGTYIMLLLSLENHVSRAEILVDVARQLGVTLEELVGRYNDSMCPKCGISLYAHEEHGGCF